MGDAVAEARRRPSVQEVFADEIANETRGPSKAEPPGERSGGLGTGGVTRWGFSTVLLQLDLYIVVSRFFGTVSKLESGLESTSSDSSGR